MAAEFYKEYAGHPEEQHRPSVFMRLVDMLMLGITVLVGMTMILTYFVPCTPPDRVWFFPVLGLFAPVTYIASSMLMLYWIVRWRWVQAGLMMAIVFVGFFKVSLFWRPDLRRSYTEAVASRERGSFKFMTYNVRNFFSDSGDSNLDDILRLIDREDPDIICFQEYNAPLAERSEAFARLCERYNKARFVGPDSLSGTWLAVLSKPRILRTGTVLSLASSVWADILIGSDTVRIFNNHLQSTAIDASDDAYLTGHRYLVDTDREVKIRSIVSRLRRSSVLRAEEADSISRAIRAAGPRRIVCGDFNDTPMSYAYRKMARGLDDAFRECGSGYSYTFRGFFNTLRIDYVLAGGLDVVSYEVLPVRYSDHLPVVVRLRRRS